MSSLLSEKDTADIRKLFSDQLVEPVILHLFIQDKTKPEKCMYCDETEQLAEEITNLSDKIRFELHQYPTDDQSVKEYDVQRVPAIIIETSAGQDTGVRFYGIPSGYEFGTLVEDLVDISTGKTKLTADLVSQVQSIQRDVAIKVFTTPT